MIFYILHYYIPNSIYQIMSDKHENNEALSSRIARDKLLYKIRFVGGNPRNLKKLCEDCGQIGVLRKEPACADYQTMVHLGCYKYICSDVCVYKCPNGHPNQVMTWDGWHDQIECNTCSVTFDAPFRWWDIYIREHGIIYGD